MHVSLTMIRYPKWAIPFGFLSMAIFRLPLWLDKKISFWRLMGSGRNGGFALRPDLRQWAILVVQNSANSQRGQPHEPLEQLQNDSHHHPGFVDTVHGLPPFINRWIKIFNGSTTSYLLEPIEGHGFWNGKEVFGKLVKQSGYDGRMAVLTRATIRLSKLKSFWKHVPAINDKMGSAAGLEKSYGIGEIPLIKQATFSIWESKEAMKQFAYQMQSHKEVVRKTHADKWYREEMFVRFKVLKIETR